MKIASSIICFFLSIAIPVAGQKLSSKAQIKILTLSPGDELYSSFGHSALWIQDDSNKINTIYNYGTFDFGPDFYYLFIQGKLNYYVSKADVNSLLQIAKSEGRGLIAQTLKLSQVRKQKAYEFAEWNLLPENRYYLYDFFYDNCSSRLRDLLQTVCGTSLVFKERTDPQKSFRQLIDLYLDDKAWQDLGMDLGLGTPADIKASTKEYMFLPDFLKEGIDNAVLIDGSSKQSLVESTEILSSKDKQLSVSNFLLEPFFFFICVLIIVLVLSALEYFKGYSIIYLDVIIFLSAGILGVVITYLWFFTDHKVTATNWNLLWANPLHIFIVPFLFNTKIKWTGWYLGASFCLIFIFIVLTPFKTQEINPDIYPFILTLAIRSLANYFRHHRFTEENKVYLLDEDFRNPLANPATA